ncbi:hypothetical protein AVEN_76170-1 [Araneus ventricosus]|uniref:Uncharacterized protein n=1 Tax=Araneus ventricosus TaxID=182803 RepID=A0A4Y2CG11_ARAVE|nr:hypothetical protein AVEN_76170-1 [Araneus ventricosus]
MLAHLLGDRMRSDGVCEKGWSKGPGIPAGCLPGRVQDPKWASGYNRRYRQHDKVVGSPPPIGNEITPKPNTGLGESQPISCLL